MELGVLVWHWWWEVNLGMEVVDWQHGNVGMAGVAVGAEFVGF